MEDYEVVRLWVDAEDYGTMSKRAAEMYIEADRGRQDCRMEPAPDGSPEFLPKTVSVQ